MKKKRFFVVIRKSKFGLSVCGYTTGVNVFDNTDDCRYLIKDLEYSNLDVDGEYDIWELVKVHKKIQFAGDD